MKSKFFNRSFIESIPDTNDEALVEISKEFSALLNQHGNDGAYSLDFTEAYALVKSFFRVRLQGKNFPDFNPSNISHTHVNAFLSSVASEAALRISNRNIEDFCKSKELEYSSIFERFTGYEFSDSDYEKIQTLISELRTEITGSGLIPAQHKRRLLNRLEAMQQELHKHTSDIDRFWGFLAEAGLVARKFGEDLKPINDRVIELGRIVTAVIMSKEGVHALPQIAQILNLN